MVHVIKRKDGKTVIVHKGLTDKATLGRIKNRRSRRMENFCDNCGRRLAVHYWRYCTPCWEELGKPMRTREVKIEWGN